MQLSDMRTRVSQRLDEGFSGPTFYPTAEITHALNEAQRFMCLLTLCLEVTATWAVPSRSANNNSAFFHMLTFFTDWIVPLRISTATGSKVRPGRLQELDCLDVQWWNSQGSPIRYTSSGADLIGLYRQPSAPGTNLGVTYARAPVDMVNDTDVPEIPEPYHARLEEYAIYRLRQGEGAQEFAKVLPLLDSFLTGASKLARYIRARNIGARYDKVPFEIESFDRSLLLKLRADLPPVRKLTA